MKHLPINIIFAGITMIAFLAPNSSFCADEAPRRFVHDRRLDDRPDKAALQHKTNIEKAASVSAPRVMLASAMIAGNPTPGTNVYPNGGMFYAGSCPTHSSEEYPGCGVRDTTTGFGYFGSDTNPGCIVKVNLATMTRIDALEVPDHGKYLTAAAIDVTSGSAYFCSATVPMRIYKIDLATFTIANVLTLPTSDGSVRGAVIDPVRHLLYVTGEDEDQFQGRFTRIDLQTFTKTGSVPMTFNDFNFFTLLFDSVGNCAYTVPGYSPGYVLKIDLTSMTRAAELPFTLNEGPFGAAGIDVANRRAYFVGDNFVMRVDLNTFTRDGSLLTLNAGEFGTVSVLVDSAGQAAYLGTHSQFNGYVIKLNLASFTRVGAINLSQRGHYASLLDAANGKAYFSSYASPGGVAQVNLSTFTYASGMTFNAGEHYVASAAVDPATNMGYFGTDTFPGFVSKIDLTAFKRVNSVQGTALEPLYDSGVVDSAGGFAYFTSSNSPSQIAKINLTNFTRTAGLPLLSGERYAKVTLLDSTRGFMYIGLNDSPARLVKIDKSSFTRVGSLTLPVNEYAILSGVIDVPNNLAWLGLGGTIPGQVVKVDLATMTRVGSVVLPAGYDYLISAVRDSNTTMGYFGTITSPGKVAKVDLGAMSFVSGITMNSGENELRSAVIDQSANAAYFGTSTNPGKVVKVDLATFTRAAAVQATDSRGYFESGLLGPNGDVFFGCKESEGRAARIATTPKGQIKGSKCVMPELGTLQSVQYYSHAAGGNVRLAIYDNGSPRILRWQSNATSVTQANGILTVPISNGTPSSLVLAAGIYWLTWQVDSTASGPSYLSTGGFGGSIALQAVGDGFALSWPFGPAPTSLDSGDYINTSEAWTEYVIYTPGLASAEDWTLYQ